MIKFLKSFFYPALITYSYPLQKENVISKIEEVLSKENSFLGDKDIRGKFINADTFIIETVNPAYTRGVKYRSTLTGKIQETQNGLTKVETQTRPSIALYVIFFVTLAAGVVYLFKFIQTTSIEFLFWSLGLILGGVIIIGLSRVAIASIQSRYKIYIDKKLSK